MNILSLNTQKAFNPNLAGFLKQTLEIASYDFILLQEATEPVLDTIRDTGPYMLLEAHDKEMQSKSHLAILYRDSFSLIGRQLYSFGNLHPFKQLQHAGFGLLLAEFATNMGNVYIGTVHLHSGWLPQIRAKELRLLKSCALALKRKGTPLLFGGDFNFGFFGEVFLAQRDLLPEFVSATKSIGPTLDSRYSEPHPNIINSTAVFLARYGIGIFLRTDHIFIDNETAQRSKTKSRVLTDRVSDHSPIELSLAAPVLFE